MASTWKDLSLACLREAKLLHGQMLSRGATSRAYYAAFSAVTHEVRKRVTSFPDGYSHPPHVQVPRFVKKHLAHLTKVERDELRALMKRMRDIRSKADYRPTELVDAHDSKDAIRDASTVLKMLGIL